jgi:hypothetical protein
MNHQKYLQQYTQQNSNLPFGDLVDRLYLYIDDLQEFEKLCQQLPFIPIETTDEIYRSVGWDEMIKLISGEELENINGLIGFSFAKSRNLVRMVAKEYQTDGFILTFDTKVMLSNFKFVDPYPSIEILKNNPRISYNLCGERIDLSDGEFNEDLHEHELDDKNYPFDRNYSKNHTNYECFKKLLEINDNNTLKKVMIASVVNETILVGSYHFISGMITDIKASNKNNLEDLYNFIQQNQDKLNLQL